MIYFGISLYSTREYFAMQSIFYYDEHKRKVFIIY